MKFLNRSRNLIVLSLLGMVWWPEARGTQSPEKSVEVGYVSLTTVQQAKKAGEPDNFAPNLLVRFARPDESRRSFAMTDDYGTAVVPLEPGTYCVTAYGLDGAPVPMSAHTMKPVNRCFSIQARKTIQWSVTVAAGVTYVRSIPRLGVSEVLPSHQF